MKNVIIIGLVLLLAGCSSRKKEVQHSSSKLDFNASIDTTAELSKQSDFKNDSSQTAHKMFLNTYVEYEGSEGDSLSIEKYGPDGQLESKTVIKGKGKLKTEATTGTEQTTRATSQTQKSDENFSASGHQDINYSAESEKQQKNIKVSGILFQSWIWLSLLVIVILIGRFLWGRYQKAKALKNHITDDFV